MSATQIVNTPLGEGASSGWTEPEADFEYRPVPALVSVAAAFAFFSLTAFILEWLILIPVVGILLVGVALWQINRSRGAYGGKAMAWSLLVIMALQLSGATGLFAYSFATEVPEGFQRVSFVSQISQHELKMVDGEMRIPAAVQQFDGQPIFFKGYMYPTRETIGLKRFVLCKDMGQCCFGGTPKPTDMIVIEMNKGQTVNYTTGLVSVAGTFRTHANVSTDELSPVYQLDCSFFSAAKTSY